MCAARKSGHAALWNHRPSMVIAKGQSGGYLGAAARKNQGRRGSGRQTGRISPVSRGNHISGSYRIFAQGCLQFGDQGIFHIKSPIVDNGLPSPSNATGAYPEKCTAKSQ